MSIQSVSGIASIWQTMKTDFQSLNQSLAAAQSAQKSGDQDQVTISQAALQKAAAAFLSDISALQSNTGDTSASTTASGSSTTGTNATLLQPLAQDLTNLQSAIQLGDQSQIKSAENTLGSDLSVLQTGHRHHHHHHGGQGFTASNLTTSGSTVPYSTGGTNMLTGTSVSSQA